MAKIETLHKKIEIAKKNNMSPETFDEIYLESFKNGFHAAIKFFHKEDFPNWREQVDIHEMNEFKKHFVQESK